MATNIKINFDGLFANFYPFDFNFKSALIFFRSIVLSIFLPINVRLNVFYRAENLKIHAKLLRASNYKEIFRIK